jgi:hypothetical protein
MSVPIAGELIGGLAAASELPSCDKSIEAERGDAPNITIAMQALQDQVFE